MSGNSFVPTKTRGFSCVALDNPKFDANVGGAMRSAKCFNANLLVVAGNRWNDEQWRDEYTDTTKAWRTIPLIRPRKVLDALPHGCEPVAVDIVSGAIPLPQFIHPERAFYIFGAEDRTLRADILDHCQYRLVIPSSCCLNLASAVTVVLYDRMVKRGEWASAHQEGSCIESSTREDE